jgi:spermidine synthase
MVQSAQAAGATVINSTFHHFAPMGVSGVVVIQESHLAIHTWPEYGYAAVDLFTCGDSVSPWVALEHLKQALQAGQVSAVEMRRGQVSLLPRAAFAPPGEAGPEGSPQRKITKELWFTERAGAIALSVRHEGEVLFQRQSACQRVEVLQAGPLGRMLALDGVMATTELDGFVMHEMLAHPALLAHPAPRRVLLLGGGDGGCLREVLKHAEVEEVLVVEQDETVVEAARQWFPEEASAFLDPRVRLQFGDARQAIEALPDGWADVAIADAYDPANMENPAWQKPFYRQLRRVLREKGLAVVQTGSPWLEQATFRAHYALLRRLFGAQAVRPLQVPVPSYPTGLWTIACLGMAHKPDPQRVRRLAAAGALRYYSEAVAEAAGVLPPFLEALTA